MEISKKMGELFFGFILIILGLLLTPTVISTEATAAVNATGAAAALLPLVVVVWVVVVIGLGIALLVTAIRSD